MADEKYKPTTGVAPTPISFPISTPELTEQGRSVPTQERKMKTKRRRYRNIFRDERGRWWLDYRTPDGKRRRKLAGKTKEDADRMLRQIRSSVDRGEYVDSTRAPGFSDYVGIFMERHGQHKASWRGGASRIAKFKEHFGNMKISKIAAGHIEDYRIIRLSEPDARDGESKLALATIDREVTMLRSLLSKAIKWKFIAKNPACDVEDYVGDGEGKRERFLSNGEIRKLLQATKHSRSTLLRPAVYLALETGMRKAELLGLRWQDVKFEANEILVPDSKSGKPRHVPMSRRARWLLNKLAARNPLAEWVFESENEKGERAPATDTKTAWKRVLRLARIEDFHFHDLRHTFASHFAMKDGNLFALAGILGHEDATMTLKRYTHLSPKYINDQRHVMDKNSSVSSQRTLNGH
jgi:integrase